MRDTENTLIKAHKGKEHGVPFAPDARGQGGSTAPFTGVPATSPHLVQAGVAPLPAFPALIYRCRTLLRLLTQSTSQPATVHHTLPLHRHLES